MSGCCESHATSEDIGDLGFGPSRKCARGTEHTHGHRHKPVLKICSLRLQEATLLSQPPKKLLFFFSEHSPAALGLLEISPSPELEPMAGHCTPSVTLS